MEKPEPSLKRISGADPVHEGGAGSLTINDIARIAGVSKKSVSRVLNNERGISEATRERIKAIMKREGYFPDRRARGLAGSRSFLLGIAYDNPNPGYVLDILQGVQAFAGERGYEVVMHRVKAQGEAVCEDIKLFMRRSGCDGLILTPPVSESAALFGAFDDESWAFARISGDDVDLPAPQIRFDDRAAAVAITAYVIQQGHRSIAFVGGPESSGPTRRRFAGFRDALMLNGINIIPDYVVSGDFTFESGLKAGQKLLSRDDAPTAIVCANDAMAVGVMHTARALGLRVPEHVSVTGFDDSPLAEQVWPPLTSVAQPVEDMAKSACEFLLRVLDGESGGTIRGRDFTHSLIVRRSVRDISGS